VNGIPIKDTELISDDESIRKIAKEAIEEMIEQNPNIINEYKNDPKVLNAFIGPCMKKSDKKIDPKKTREILREILSEY
jgi:Asp-tRNA(Asn)/Glu-tRNA(Gln) amidotransferase B subunit